MSAITLKSLHNCLKLLENPSELKRRLPASSNPRTLKEGLYQMSRLVGVEEAVFEDPETIAALIGAQRFVMMTNAASVASSNSVRSASIIAGHFERFGRGEATKDRANQEIADHLLAVARQFSADTKPG
jgi:hypothetical protein